MQMPLDRCVYYAFHHTYQQGEASCNIDVLHLCHILLRIACRYILLLLAITKKEAFLTAHTYHAHSLQDTFNNRENELI